MILAGSPLFSTNIELIKKDKSERVYRWHRIIISRCCLDESRAALVRPRQRDF